MNLTLNIGNSDERFPAVNVIYALTRLNTLEVDDFIILEPTEPDSLNRFFQAFRCSETDYLCEYCDGQTKFRSDPVNVSLPVIQTCVMAYCTRGHLSDEFQSATRWVQHEDQPELSSSTSELASLKTDPPAMSGLDFEKLIAKRLQDDGWTTRLTRRTGDQGLDLFAFDEEFRVAIQCKRYTEPVSNGAVQEVHAAADVLKATHAVVIVSSRYTDSAIALATTLGVILLTIDQLHELRSHLVFMQPRQVRLRAPRLFLDA